MAAGLPIITTLQGAAPEVIDQGITGILVPSKDPETLAEAILKLSGDKELRIRMGLEGRRKAEREYDWDKIVEDYIAIYDKM